jgi:hypothetical protein
MRNRGKGERGGVAFRSRRCTGSIQELFENRIYRELTPALTSTFASILGVGKRREKRKKLFHPLYNPL